MWMQIMFCLQLKKKEVSIVLKVILEKKPTKKRFNVSSFEISKNFGEKDPLKKLLSNKNKFYNIVAFWLSKITYPFNLWKVHGWRIL